MPEQLDERTQQIYEFVRDFHREHHICPTIREIGKACYISSTTVLPHLAKLEAWGWIVRDFQIPRSIRLGERAPDYKEES